jgi:hypothetical protein
MPGKEWFRIRGRYNEAQVRAQEQRRWRVALQ